MVTTRSDRVVSSMQASVTYPLSRLSYEDSWTMFKRRAFTKGEAVEANNLVDMGREMVERCGGLPLAIKALGGLMNSKKSELEWRSVQSSQLWDLEDEMGRVLPTLELSYEHLPSSLKHCFAFCSIFPKDFDLEKSELIQIWMALGWLRPPKSSDLSMENIGDKYFNTLFFNSLLQDAKKDEYNSITSCKMHDVVHDLALNKSDEYCSTLVSSQLNGDSTVVHLSLISSLREIPENSKKICSRLRTLIIKGDVDGKLLANFECLRVLVLDNYVMEVFPNSIGKLKHLRYLDISKTSIFSLPDTITKLYNLQTLRLHKVAEVPKSFGNLINLRHFHILDVDDSMHCMLIGIGQLTFLQTLPFFVVNRDKGCDIKELGSLDNLRGDLTIFGLEDVENSGEAKHANLSKKSHLRILTLCWGGPVDIRKNKAYNDEDVLEGLEPPSNLKGFMIKNFAGGKFPSWMIVESRTSSVLRNLVKIKLSYCNGCEQIPPLWHLQYLKAVEIIGMDNVKVIGAEFYGKHVADGGASSSSGAAEVAIFPALRELTLWQMPRLEKWLEAVQQSGSMSVFPCLEKLKIGMCSSLITIPHHFPSLRKLSISDCDRFSYLPNNIKAVISDLSIFYCPSLSLLSILPSVKEISIVGCKKLIGLPSLTQFFPLIEKLYVNGCPNLLAFPEMHCHTFLRELVIVRCEKLTSVPQLCTSLQSLHILGCERLTSVPQLCASLQGLYISGCKRLTSLPELGTTLEELDISNCPAMVSFPDFRYLQKLRLYKNSEELDYFPWPSSSSTSTTCDVAVEDNDGIQRLKHVDLKGWLEIKSLPDQLRHLSALTYLKLSFFHGLESLPEWLGILSSLQSFSIINCKKLMYMPSVEAMRRLTNLTYLEILVCPLLQERCNKVSGPEWEKISHITTIKIFGESIDKYP